MVFGNLVPTIGARLPFVWRHGLWRQLDRASDIAEVGNGITPTAGQYLNAVVPHYASGPRPLPTALRSRSCS